MVKFECNRLKAQVNSAYDFDEILTDEILKDIALRISGSSDYTITWKEERNIGRFIIAWFNDKKNYISLSQYGEVGSRNNYLQSVPTAYEEYYNDSYTNKQFCYYCLPFKGNNTTPYILFGYKMMKTAKIKFLNESLFMGNKIIEPFKNMQELLKKKQELRISNSSNKSSYITDEGDCYHIYGKTFGANGKETCLMCYAITKIADKPVKLFPIFDNDATTLSDKSKNAISDMGKIIVLNETFTMDDSNKETKEDEDIRSPKFIYNLLCKFGHKKCCLCGCEIDSIVQAAHIWPVAAIKKANLTLDEKKKYALDGENGIWLCENHHKLFDTNLIIFDLNGKAKFSKKLDDNNKTFVKEITKTPEIDPSFVTVHLKKYLSKRMDYYFSA